MHSNNENDYNAFRLNCELLLHFLRKHELQDEYNFAVRLFILWILYSAVQQDIDGLSSIINKDYLVSKQRFYEAEYQKVIIAISLHNNINMTVTGSSGSNPSIQDLAIKGLDANELHSHLQLWKDSLESTSHDLALVGTIDRLASFLLSGYGDIPPVPPENFIMVPSTRLAHQLRMALATRAFTVPREDLWPQTSLQDDRAVQVFALLQPHESQKKKVFSDQEEAQWQEHMLELADSMTDLTVDVFDILCDALLKNGDASGIDALPVEEILLRRRLIKHKGGTGRRGGYNQKQRQAIDQQREILNNLYLIRHCLKQDKGNAGSGSQSSFLWSACNDLFGMRNQSRQTALLSQQALQYNPYRQAWEKRLTRYLAWLWRIRKDAKKCEEPIAVEALLLNAVGGSMDKDNPLRTLSRLEKALDRLRSDAVIQNWKYANDNDKWRGREGWQKSWLSQKITVEPPAMIIEHYQKIKETIAPPKAEKVLQL